MKDYRVIVIETIVREKAIRAGNKREARRIAASVRAAENWRDWNISEEYDATTVVMARV
jgi:hypothetical protein